MCTLQNSNSEVTKEVANLEAKLKQKGSLIKSLEKQLNEDAVNNNDNTKIEIVPMNTNTSGHSCVACKSRFSTNIYLEKHTKDKHKEADCLFCSKTFLTTTN